MNPILRFSPNGQIGRRNGLFAIDALCASAILIALLSTVTLAVVKIAGDRRTLQQHCVAEQVILNTVDRIQNTDAPIEELESLSVPDWAQSQLPNHELLIRAEDLASETTATTNVPLDTFRVTLTWSNRPAAPPESLQVVCWRKAAGN